MDCPQCGTALTTYTLQGHEALVCERCGYVGIDADHHGTRRSAESWHDALRRFYDESGVDSDPHVPVRPDGESGEDDESARPTPRPSPDGAPALERIGGEDRIRDDSAAAEPEGGEAKPGSGEAKPGSGEAESGGVDDGVRSPVGES